MKESPESRCRLNIERWFRDMGRLTCPIIETPPLAPRADRCYVTWSLELRDYLAARMDRWNAKINAHRPLGVMTAIQGWRERRARWAAQVIDHYHPQHGRFLEIDFDASNPNWGWALFISHGMFDWAYQKIRGRSTDPWKVAEKRGWTAAGETNA